MQKSQLLKTNHTTLELNGGLELELNNSLEHLQQMTHASAMQMKTAMRVLNDTGTY